MFIIPFDQHEVILNQPWMNKNGVFLYSLRNNFLDRCQHERNEFIGIKKLPNIFSNPFTS